ncbi:FecCD family ABC transporter permease [Nakamurella deserti]|uniref:FecCD family ABC transporter permease n=1 Tax=Nakamurella deserti TaxID=2164074 RepID=UPI000DBE3C24|nr:iron chelate uptake ABC transporter family permease subunit [Nakamurella deserti]
MSLDEAVRQADTALLRSRSDRRRRHWIVAVALTVTLVAAGLLALMLGSVSLSPGQVLGALVGDGDRRSTLVVQGLRLPRLILALLAGAAFGLAGALFQSVLRNPLASPDIIGITQGASVGAVLAILGLGLTGPWVFGMALAGGFLVGGLLWVVAARGGLAGFRFVLAGIGVAYLAGSVLGYLLTRTQVQQAQTALQWLAGSVAQADPAMNRLLAVLLAVLLVATIPCARALQALRLGDDTATALGVRPARSRLLVIAVGVGLASLATAAAGPIAFVAFTAAPIARRLLRDGSLALLPATLVGALMVVAADLVAQHLLPADMAVPAGVITGVVGGPYLIWLLATARRTRETPR